ncbi:MAG TPA: hypothetical protein VFX40_05875 [Gemmatimonadaceae bacterium]|nr:hypothetical protein [Gemmatimonadaceae bacterium]
MFIELIDLLRCPVPHEDSWLVAAFTDMDGRFVRKGKLGCPVCSKTYPIIDGTAFFAPARSADATSPAAASEDEVVRAAALLGLTRPGALVVIVGSSAGAAQLAEMTESKVIVVNPGTRIDETERVGIVTAGERIPLADGSADGLITDDSSEGLIAEAARLLRPGGRIVAGAGTDLGPRFHELARDERNVVAESRGPLVGITRQ